MKLVTLLTSKDSEFFTSFVEDTQSIDLKVTQESVDPYFLNCVGSQIYDFFLPDAHTPEFSAYKKVFYANIEHAARAHSAQYVLLSEIQKDEHYPAPLTNQKENQPLHRYIVGLTFFVDSNPDYEANVSSDEPEQMEIEDLAKLGFPDAIVGTQLEKHQ